jgi:hypothetical protein
VHVSIHELRPVPVADSGVSIWTPGEQSPDNAHLLPIDDPSAQTNARQALLELHLLGVESGNTSQKQKKRE